MKYSNSMTETALILKFIQQMTTINTLDVQHLPGIEEK